MTEGPVLQGAEHPQLPLQSMAVECIQHMEGLGYKTEKATTSGKIIEPILNSTVPHK